MKIIVSSDLHGNRKGVMKIAGKAKELEADLVTISGDITHFGSRDVLTPLLEPIDREILAVTGNCDPIEVNHHLHQVDRVTNLNGNIVQRKGWNFCGYAYQDKPIQEVLPLVPKENLILVSHVPARGILDKSKYGRNGDGRINAWVGENAPRIVLTGHIHESPGIEKHGETTFINPGPARDGKLVLLTIGKNGVEGAEFI